MRGVCPTPLGPVWVQVTSGTITASGWGDQVSGATTPTTPATAADDRLLAEALGQLDAYFAGSRQAFDLPLAQGADGLTGRVLDALCRIPFGETRSYGDLARALGAPAQAIGQACGANPLPILIPCRRVLGATSLGSYSGAGGVENKVWLLRHEGAAGLLI